MKTMQEEMISQKSKTKKVTDSFIPYFTTPFFKRISILKTASN